MTKYDFFKKPTQVTDEDWSLYMHAIAAMCANTPVGLKVYEGYKRVEKAFYKQHGLKKSVFVGNYKNFPSCVKRNYD
jgi:hypothetical protein